MGTYNNSDYAVYWYAPDGNLYEKQKPSCLFIDCNGLKSSLTIDANKMSSKTGLWKAEVTYKDVVIDNRYFYLTTSGIKKEINQEDSDLLESKIKRDEKISRTYEESDKKKTAILEEEAKIKNKELIQKITSDVMDTEKARVLVDSYFTTSDKDVEAIKDSGGLTHIAYGSEKIYWRGQFPPFFGVGSPKIQIYWLTPQKYIFSTNSTTFMPTNDVSFSIKGVDIKEDMLGEWQVVVYVNKSKIVEQKFILEGEEKVKQMISKTIEETTRLTNARRKEMVDKEKTSKEEVVDPELEKITRKKLDSMTNKYIAEIRKKYSKDQLRSVRIGDSEELVLAAQGKPFGIVPRKDGIEIWYYWQASAWDNAASVSYAVNRDIIGQIFQDPKGDLTKIFIEDGKVIEMTTEQNVAKSQIR